MIRRQSAPIEPAIDRSHIVTDYDRAGEYVRVVGDAGVSLGGVYRIQCHAMNTETGTEWLEMFGPKTFSQSGGADSGQFHACRPDRVRPATPGEIRRAIPKRNEETE